MEEAKSHSTSSSDVKVIHVKVIGGTQADIYDIGDAMKKFKETLPYKLEAIISNENVELQDINVLIRELFRLKREIEEKKLLEEGNKDEVSNLPK